MVNVLKYNNLIKKINILYNNQVLFLFLKLSLHLHFHKSINNVDTVHNVIVTENFEEELHKAS